MRADPSPPVAPTPAALAAPPLALLADILLGRDEHLRPHVRFVASLAYFYAVCGAVILHSVALGSVPHREGQTLAWMLALAWLGIYALVRSGLTRRFEDPSATLLHAHGGMLVNAVGYLMAGPTRGTTLFLQALVLVILMFRLKPQQVHGVAAAGIVETGAAMAWLHHTDAAAFPLHVALAHFVLLAACLPTIAWIGASVSRSRLRLLEQRRQLHGALAEVEQLATRDMLTGLANRGHMQSRLDRLGPQDTPASVAILDIDYFKAINDSWGHATGDEVLRGVARIVGSAVRPGDVLARWGGEEFLLLMPRTLPGQARQVVEAARLAVASAPLLPEAPQHAVSFSAGVAAIDPNGRADAAVERADAALYRAKALGRNRCEEEGADDRAAPPSKPARGWVA